MIATLLMFWFSAEFGVEPFNGAWFYWQEDAEGLYHEMVMDEELTYYTDLTARITLGRVLYVEGNARTRMNMVTLTNFSPFILDYGFEAGAQIGPVTVGWRHLCYHPIFTYAPVRSLIGEDRRYPIEGAFDQVFIRIEGGSR